MKAGLSVVAAFLAVAAHADPAAWHVSDSSGAQMWLLGSVHYLSERDYPLPAIVDELYSKADEIVMEIDLDDIDPLQIQTQFLSAAMLPDGKKLSDVVTSGTYAEADAAAGALGVDLSLLSGFKPWLAAVTLLDLGMSRIGYVPDRGIEQYILGKAVADGKPVRGLETLSAQIGIFDDLDDRAQEALLEQTVAELDSAEAPMQEMVDAWRNGRLDALTDSLMSDFDGFPGLYDALVASRNRNWITELEAMMSPSTSHLVVVGALHLVGEDSVIQLLESKGYRVTRVD